MSLTETYAERALRTLRDALDDLRGLALAAGAQELDVIKAYDRARGAGERPGGRGLMSLLSTKTCPAKGPLSHLNDRFLVCSCHPNLWEIRGGKVVNPSLLGTEADYARVRAEAVEQGQRELREKEAREAEKKRERRKTKAAA